VVKWAERRAIDVHVHVNTARTGGGEDARSEELRRATGAHFKANSRVTMADIAAYYGERNMACVVFAVDSEAGTGRSRIDSEEIIEAAQEHPDLIIPFGSVDPWRGKAAESRARDLISAGVRGFKFQPSTQAFFPNDHQFYKLYSIIEEAGLPAVFHTGQTGVGARMKGGGGIRLKYSHPMLLDDVAVDFPDLKIIMAHPAVPWQDEQLAVAVHKQNVFIDLSGWAPKYFEPKLVQYAKSMLSDKVLFGSDFPLLSPDRWLAEFAELGFDEEKTRKVLVDNALRVLGLAEDDAGD
jgi:uncharacterized protein